MARFCVEGPDHEEALVRGRRAPQLDGHLPAAGDRQQHPVSPTTADYQATPPLSPHVRDEVEARFFGSDDYLDVKTQRRDPPAKRSSAPTPSSTAWRCASCAPLGRRHAAHRHRGVGYDLPFQFGAQLRQHPRESGRPAIPYGSARSRGIPVPSYLRVDVGVDFVGARWTFTRCRRPVAGLPGRGRHGPASAPPSSISQRASYLPHHRAVRPVNSRCSAGPLTVDPTCACDLYTYNGTPATSTQVSPPAAAEPVPRLRGALSVHPSGSPSRRRWGVTEPPNPADPVSPVCNPQPTPRSATSMCWDRHHSLSRTHSRGRRLLQGSAPA